MEKTLAKYKQAAKKKNSGFTLVELIVVIAIMGVLVAVLTPQYLQYVEKSKVAADNSAADSILSAVKVAASDADVTWNTGTTTVTWSGTSITVDAGGANVSGLETALGSSIDGKSISTGTISVDAPKASTHKGKKYVITFTVGTDGIPSVTPPSDWAT